MAFNVNEQDNLVTTDTTTTTTTSDPVAPTPELSDESLDENIDDAFNELQVDEQVVEPIVAEEMESEPTSPIPPQPTESETEPEIKPEINNEPVDNEQPPTPVERRPSNEKLLAAKTAVYESEPPVSQPPPPKEMPQVGSINDRLNKYQSASSLLDEEKQPDSPVTRPNQPKVGKLTDRKDSYLKQANNASSPSHAAPVRMASSGLMERMKQLEDSSKGGTLVRRETVNMGERASDIKSRINGWGKANTTDNVLR